jgi:photosystem II stability/assembly factor-like uncharacterized protein
MKNIRKLISFPPALACGASVFLLSLITACASPTERTPTPYPDTPSPAQITAPLVETPSLVSIKFLNELDGWGVTETQIVRTNDGGITWYNVTPPNLTEAGYSVEAEVLDNDHVWVQKTNFDGDPNSGLLYRTSDGGLAWTESTTPFGGGDLDFIDENNGWMLAGLGVGAGSMGISIFQTSDSGETWEQKYTNDPNLTGAGDSLPLGGLKNGIAPLNMQTAWVYGVVYAPGNIYLFRTEDGGENWSPVSVELPANAENFEVSIDRDQMRFVSATDGFMVLRMVGETTQTAVYTTRDSGSTWTLSPTLIPNGGASDFLSSEEAVIYNGEQFYVTRDAARTWTIIPPDIKFGETFAGMDFVNALSGWVITLDPTNNGRSLYRTSDGGATWFPVVQ